MAEGQGGAAAGLQKLNRAVADLKLDPEAEPILGQLVAIETAIQEANRAFISGGVQQMAGAGQQDPMMGGMGGGMDPMAGMLAAAASQAGSGAGPTLGGMPPMGPPGPPGPQSTVSPGEVSRLLP